MTEPGRRRVRRALESGQSIVEFALIVPILVVLMVAIVDLARIYTTMISVESAAREAADFGTFGSQKWNPTILSVTEADMKLRACTAASKLPDYIGPNDNCSNPTFAYAVSGNKGATWGASNTYDPLLACDNAVREPPCWIRVTLRYDFQLLAPLHIEMFGVEFGFPNTLTFERSSIFAMTDMELP